MIRIVLTCSESKSAPTRTKTSVSICRTCGPRRPGHYIWACSRSCCCCTESRDSQEKHKVKGAPSSTCVAALGEEDEYGHACLPRRTATRLISPISARKMNHFFIYLFIYLVSWWIAGCFLDSFAEVLADAQRRLEMHLSYTATQQGHTRSYSISYGKGVKLWTVGHICPALSLYLAGEAIQNHD